MKVLRSSFLAASLALLPAAVSVLIPRDAHASVSIAIGFNQLVKDADSVAVMTPLESKSVWEDGKIYTYTKLKVEQGVAGDLGTGGETWVRTMGGVVGKIGQMVDGEPVFTGGKSSLLFLRKFKATGTWEVSARAQGQWPVVVGTDNKRKVIRSANVGVLYPPKENTTVAAAGTVTTQGAGPVAPASAAEVVRPIRLASEVLHDRAFDDATREIASSWRTLHAPASSGTPSDAKK